VSYVCSRTSTWEDHNFEKILKHVWSRVGITDLPSHQPTAHYVPPRITILTFIKGNGSRL